MKQELVGDLRVADHVSLMIGYFWPVKQARLSSWMQISKDQKVKRRMERRKRMLDHGENETDSVLTIQALAPPQPLDKDREDKRIKFSKRSMLQALRRCQLL
ncbi:MAG: hypothetical protein DRH43_04940 [Deltaproteobacteria bacterium]|nr:MAG: hypothetical protein DRH50_02690 [Deltaproteobacteria bacterium]RLC11098.1 MAG: hypothetical protein DRH43_04940 [Deltaproteobacteria bacterium]